MIELVKRAHCPACSATSTKTLIELPFAEAPVADHLLRYYSGAIPMHDLASFCYCLQLCQNCGLIYQQDILNDAGMDMLYSQWINGEASLRKKLTAPLEVRAGYARQCAQVIKAVGRPPSEIRVLDFGMGWGAWLLVAKAFGMQTEGLEVAEDRVLHARQNGLVAIWPAAIAAETYEFINAEQVLEHVSDPAGVLESCYRWLKPGGMLRIAVPDGKNLVKRIQTQRWTIAEMESRPLEHINIFTHESLTYLARQQHFKVVHPPLVLPMLGVSRREIKHCLNVLLFDVATRARLLKPTLLWLQK